MSKPSVLVVYRDGETELNDYARRIIQLFGLIAVCNTADSPEPAEEWLVSYDASSQGLYGKTRDLIIELAGNEIYDHWVRTNEVDIKLAKRC
jgi:hypothetical protein